MIPQEKIEHYQKEQEARALIQWTQRNPWEWVERSFGDVPLFPKQEQILNSLRDKKAVYVKACHASTKTRTAAYALLWWMCCYPLKAKVLSTAPIWAQIVDNLWRVVRGLYDTAKARTGGFGGRMLQAEWDIDPQWFAKGQSSDRGINFQGLHSENILVIIDEADGISKEIWEAIDGVLTSQNSRLLAIGNPLDPTSEFKKRCDAVGDKKRGKEVVIQIRAADTPNIAAGKVVYPYLITPEWVENALDRYKINGAMYIGKVLAEWPDQRTDTLIPLPWLLRARTRSVMQGIRTLGVDVARHGTNRTVRTMLAGNQLIASNATSKEDTMLTASRVLTDISSYGPAHVAVDETGVGGGVLDRLNQIRKMDRALPPISGVNNGEKSSDPDRFVNLGAEMYWRVREAFERDEIGLAMDDMDTVDELISDLNRPTYEYVREAKLKIDKFGLPRGVSEFGLSDEERSRRSPDRGDSFVLAFNAALPYIRANRNTVAKVEEFYKYVRGSVNI